MRIKKLMKLGGLVVAGLVTLLVGHSHYSFADKLDREPRQAPLCTNLDYAGYVHAQNNSTEEMTPAFALSLSESFLAKCPDRPEAGRVALSAASEALDAGDAEAASRHFQTALTRGAAFDQQARMDFMIMLLANGREVPAWKIRDAEIATWLEKLEDDGLTHIAERSVVGGSIYTLSFDEVDPVRRERLVWVAVPKGEGLPASVSLSSEVQLVELARLRVGPAAVNLEQIVLNRCAGRDTLSTSFSGYDEADIAKLAVDMLTDYLATPDTLEQSEEGQPIMTCLEVERLLVAPDPANSIPVY